MRLTGPVGGRSTMGKNHGTYLNASGKAGREDVVQPRLIHRGYGLKSETQALMSHGEQVMRLLGHVAKLKKEIERKGTNVPRERSLAIAIAELDMHLAADAKKGVVYRG